MRSLLTMSLAGGVVLAVSQAPGPDAAATVTVPATSQVSATVRTVQAQGSTGEKWRVRGMAAGDQTVPGLGARKQQLRDAGANVQDIAVAMMESDDMTSSYDYGDNKIEGATNFGIFKQNWAMLAASNTDLRNMGRRAAGQKLNTDLRADIAAMHNSRDSYGDRWADGQRNGADGLADPTSEEVKNYRAALWFTQKKLYANPELQRDDTRIWVDVPAI